MAFPQVRSTATSATATATTSHTVDLPAGVSGDMLLAFSRRVSGTVAYPAGWRPLFVDDDLDVWFRVANGSEGSSVTVTTSSNTTLASVVHRIEVGTFNDATPGVASAGSQNPPAVDPQWPEARDGLWFTAWSTRRTDQSAVVAPTGYGNVSDVASNAASSSTNDVRLAVARLEANAASEDPDTWDITGSTSSTTTATVAVSPPHQASGYFPQVRDVVSSTDEGTTHTMDLPSGETGDLLVAVVARGDTGITFTQPTGWTWAGSGSTTTAVFWRIADGGEGPTATYGTSSSRPTAATVYRFEAGTFDATATPVVAADTPDTNTLDPPSLTPGWTGDVLWIALARSRSGTATFGAPTAFGNQIDVTDGADIDLTTARLERTGSSYDPDSFAAVGFNSGTSGTAAVLGAEPSGTVYDETGLGSTIIAGTGGTDHLEAEDHHGTVIEAATGGVASLEATETGGTTLAATTGGADTVEATETGGTTVVATTGGVVTVEADETGTGSTVTATTGGTDTLAVVYDETGTGTTATTSTGGVDLAVYRNEGGSTLTATTGGADQAVWTATGGTSLTTSTGGTDLAVWAEAAGGTVLVATTGGLDWDPNRPRPRGQTIHATTRPASVPGRLAPTEVPATTRPTSVPGRL